jgi:hypothetical protein
VKEVIRHCEAAGRGSLIARRSPSQYATRHDDWNVERKKKCSLSEYRPLPLLFAALNSMTNP